MSAPDITHVPLAGLLRRGAAGTGSFGGIVFQFGLAIRRLDDTVLVQVEGPVRAQELRRALEDVGVAQLDLGIALCRARAVGWDAALCAVIFELHRAEAQAA